MFVARLQCLLLGYSVAVLVARLQCLLLGYRAHPSAQSDAESPDLLPITETAPLTETTPPSLEVATDHEHQQKVTINEEITEIPQGTTSTGTTCTTKLLLLAENVTYRPAVVFGEKAVEEAVIDGCFPVVDKQVDVFAVPCVEGKLVLLFQTHLTFLSRK